MNTALGIAGIVWADRLDAAGSATPDAFARNGWVVEALQGAWSAISGTPVPAEDRAAGTFRAQHLRLALEAGVRGGRDTDTVAAIAGGLLGAAYGASAVPATWRRIVHGWPGLRARGLLALGDAIVKVQPFNGDYSTWSHSKVLVPHPYDDGVLLGSIDAVRPLPAGIDAVISLCRVGESDVPRKAEHVEVRLIDSDNPAENPDLAFVLDDTVRVIRQSRAEGKTVLVHCVQAQSRTPTVAALYGAMVRGVAPARALDDVLAVLPHAQVNAAFRALLRD